VGHKKCATLFWTITPHFLMDFNTLCNNKNRKKYSIGELQNLQHYHNCVSTLSEKFKNTQNSMTVGDRFLPYVQSNQSCATFAESHIAFILSNSC